MAQLEACPSCSRHVRVTTERCPFCDAVLPAGFRALAARALPARRLSRAATFALGVALGAATEGCYLSHQIGDDGGETAVDLGSSIAAYGLAADAGRRDAGSFAPPYGIAPHDGGPPDAGPPDLGGVTILYGGPSGG